MWRRKESPSSLKADNYFVLSTQVVEEELSSISTDGNGLTCPSTSSSRCTFNRFMRPFLLVVILF